jgi:hypothetical protein
MFLGPFVWNGYGVHAPLVGMLVCLWFFDGQI